MPADPRLLWRDGSLVLCVGPVEVTIAEYDYADGCGSLTIDATHFPCLTDDMNAEGVFWVPTRAMAVLRGLLEPELAVPEWVEVSDAR